MVSAGKALLPSLKTVTQRINVHFYYIISGLYGGWGGAVGTTGATDELIMKGRTLVIVDGGTVLLSGDKDGAGVPAGGDSRLSSFGVASSSKKKFQM